MNRQGKHLENVRLPKFHTSSSAPAVRGQDSETAERPSYLWAVPDVHRNFLENHHPASHDSASVAASRRIEAEAYAEYCRVLATYTELATNGTRRGPDPPVVTMISKGRAKGSLR